MGRHRVVDIRRLQIRESPAAELDDSSERELSFLGGIVEVVTANGVSSGWERSIVRCDDGGCDNIVGVRRTGDACEWYCPNCRSFGAVVGWRNGRWDLSEVVQRDETDRTEAVIFTRFDELACVRRCNLSPTLKLTLALATVQADYVLVTCAERELSELLCALEELIGHVPIVERTLIDRFVARVDSALLACEARADIPPTLH